MDENLSGLKVKSNFFMIYLVTIGKMMKLKGEKWRIQLGVCKIPIWEIEKFRISMYHQGLYFHFYFSSQNFADGTEILNSSRIPTRIPVGKAIYSNYSTTYLVLVPKMVYEKMVYPVLQMDTRLSLRLIWTSSVAEVPVDQVLNL